MTEARRYALNAQLDIEQILSEAQHRWLRPAEICEILQNYRRFRIASEPPSRPPSGSLFLFDRKVLRYFRKDGHSWRKKKDGKTVKEAHERLKAGSIDVLHCYYAHGEDNENFQRRSYWLLEEDMSHIVLVHYREVKGNRTNYNRNKDTGSISDSQHTEETASNSEIDSSVASKSQSYDYQGTSPLTDTFSLNSSRATEYEDVESAYRRQTSPGFHSIHRLHSSVVPKMECSLPQYPVFMSGNYQGQIAAVAGTSFGLATQNDRSPIDNVLTYELNRGLGFSSWDNVGESRAAGYDSLSFQSMPPTTEPSAKSMTLGQENKLLGGGFTGAFDNRQDFGSHSDGLDVLQTSERHSMCMSGWSADPKPDKSSMYGLDTKINEVHPAQQCSIMGSRNAYLPEQNRQPMQNVFQSPAINVTGSSFSSESHGNLNLMKKFDHVALKPTLLDDIMRGDLKKLDSFDRWMSKELGDVAETPMLPDPGMYWEAFRAEDVVDSSSNGPVENFMLGHSLSQEQLFSILDFSPNWAFSGSEVEVRIMGRFLKSKEEVGKYKWACMFGELQVPAEIISDGVLHCYTPLHVTGRVPFYLTYSNQLACSEVREFEFRTNIVQDVELKDLESIGSVETLLYMRFGKLLSLEPVTPLSSAQRCVSDAVQISTKISELLKDDAEWEQMLYLTKHDEFSEDKVKVQLLQKLLKEKLHLWLLQKVAEGGKGASLLDDGGQGVLHFAAALGYEWAIQPTIAAGVSVNFRDINGLTALHWAALFGREHTVAFLVSLGAAPGALTDPSPTYPSGRTPADLASSKGHKGIAGYLAETALSSHLSSLKLDAKEGDRIKEVDTISGRVATPVGVGDSPHGLSLKDSLAAVRNATQTASRIQQVFRAQSFQRKQLKKIADGEFVTPEEHAISTLAGKSLKTGHHNDYAHAAAVRIQNKFRGWQVRNEYLSIRQRIIKIQAHVRGHQVRKNYKKIIWSVGILDKVILRWRRKGRGLSGFKPEALTTEANMQERELKEDDYDFLREGRKQTEQRLQKALARVKSMVQYPEARDQYRRLLNVVSEMQEKKAAYDKAVNNPEVEFDDDLIDLGMLLDDDTLDGDISMPAI